MLNVAIYPKPININVGAENVSTENTLNILKNIIVMIVNLETSKKYVLTFFEIILVQNKRVIPKVS